MKRLRDLRLLALVGVLGFLGAFAATAVLTRPTSAQQSPGVVSQSSAASDSGLTVTIERATFTGMSVDVDLLVESVDGATAVAGIRPSHASLSSVLAVSAHDRRDGRVSLRFPAEAWTDGPRATLAVRGVEVFEGARLAVIPGAWDLDVRLPEGDDAAAARSVEALDPVAVDIGGTTMEVYTFISAAETVVRYRLPASVRSYQTPTLLWNGEPVRAKRAEQIDAMTEVRYAVPARTGTLALVFDALAARDPNGAGWTLSITSAAFSKPPDAQEGEFYPVAWSRSGGDGPEVHAVEWQPLTGRPRLVLTLVGTWDPGQPAEGEAQTWPTVTGDGKGLRVVGVGLLNATTERGPRTVIHAELGRPGANPPRDLVVTVAEGTTAIPATNVQLRP